MFNLSDATYARHFEDKNQLDQRPLFPGMVSAIDACHWKHPISQIFFLLLNIIYEASRFHVATVLMSGPSRYLGNCSSKESVDALNIR